jgi:hypothetical protein
MIELLQRFSFGALGDVRPSLGEGWSAPEAEFTWTNGPQARLRLPYEPGPGALMLEIAVNPMLVEPVLLVQRLILNVNGVQVGSEAVALECSLGFDIPGIAHASAETLDILIECPDAVLPAALGSSSPDRRLLGFAVREIMLFRAPEHQPFDRRFRPPLPKVAGGPEEAVRGLTGLSLPDLAQCFESLGHNCEFGLAQRGMGQEGWGLLRYAGISLQKLVEGLDFGFEGIDAPDNLMTYLSVGKPVGEIIVRDKHYRMSIHSEQTELTSSRSEVLRQSYLGLGLRRRKLLEDLATGHKIFVFQHPDAKSIAYVRPILNILRSYGPNTLLFVTEDPAQPSGSVHQLELDLFHGYIAALAPVDRVPELDVASWISICANTYRLWRESGQGA